MHRPLRRSSARMYLGRALSVWFRLHLRRRPESGAAFRNERLFAEYLQGCRSRPRAMWRHGFDLRNLSFVYSQLRRQVRRGGRLRRYVLGKLRARRRMHRRCLRRHDLDHEREHPGRTRRHEDRATSRPRSNITRWRDSGRLRRLRHGQGDLSNSDRGSSGKNGPAAGAFPDVRWNAKKRDLGGRVEPRRTFVHHALPPHPRPRRLQRAHR